MATSNWKPFSKTMITQSAPRHACAEKRFSERFPALRSWRCRNPLAQARAPCRARNRRAETGDVAFLAQSRGATSRATLFFHRRSSCGFHSAHCNGRPKISPKYPIQEDLMNKHTSFTSLPPYLLRSAFFVIMTISLASAGPIIGQSKVLRPDRVSDLNNVNLLASRACL